MTEADLTFLKSHIDKPVVLETTQGDSFLAQVLFIFDEGDTPDLFCLQLEPTTDGTYIKKNPNGLSILLADIAATHPAP
jgi:hypothetical protein